MKKHIHVSLVAVGLLGLAALSATAETLNFNFSTAGAPTFNRPVAEQDYPLTPDQVVLSELATDVPYFFQPFVVSLSGLYDFSIVSATFDTYIALYSSFNPALGATNVVAVNDDIDPGVFGPSGLSAISLNASTTYTFVITGYSNEDSGTGAASITGPGAITAVPEPHETAALMAAAIVLIAFLRKRRQARS